MILLSGPATGCGPARVAAAGRTRALKVVARLPPGPDRESSGIVRSRKHPDLFWVHNDSGDEPRLYPIHRDGSPYRSTDHPDVPGVLIEGATHVDWEDITTLADGTLVIADLGNNGNARKDLAIYFVDEPRRRPAVPPPPGDSRSAIPTRRSSRRRSQTSTSTAKRSSPSGRLSMCSRNTAAARETKLYRLDQPQTGSGQHAHAAGRL